LLRTQVQRSNVANDSTIDPATSNDELVTLLERIPQIEQGMQKPPTEPLLITESECMWTA
jgi:hypothetical protein